MHTCKSNDHMITGVVSFLLRFWRHVCQLYVTWKINKTVVPKHLKVRWWCAYDNDYMNPDVQYFCHVDFGGHIQKFHFVVNLRSKVQTTCGESYGFIWIFYHCNRTVETHFYTIVFLYYITIDFIFPLPWIFVFEIYSKLAFIFTKFWLKTNSQLSIMCQCIVGEVVYWN